MICCVDEHIVCPGASSDTAAEDFNHCFLPTFVTLDARCIFCNKGIDFFQGGGKGGGGGMIVDMEVAKEAIELILTGRGAELTMQHGDGGSEVVDEFLIVGLVVCEGVRAEDKV